MEKETRVKRVMLMNKSEISDTHILIERDNSHELITLTPVIDPNGDLNTAIVKNKNLSPAEYKGILHNIILEMNSLSKNKQSHFFIYGKSNEIEDI